MCSERMPANDAFIPTGHYQIVNYLSTKKVDSEDTIPESRGMKPDSKDILFLYMDETGKVTLQKQPEGIKQKQKQRWCIKQQVKDNHVSFTIMNDFTKKYLSSQTDSGMPSIGDLVIGRDSEKALLWDIQAPEVDYYSLSASGIRIHAAPCAKKDNVIVFGGGGPYGDPGVRWELHNTETKSS